ncbi:hypothetical protein TNCV_2665051 [Trichonephila clavipes]|nr:hypothetical protein TNCV_2665051 [Trichonephila clavipes]
MKQSFLKRKPMAVAQSPQLGEVHPMAYNQRRPHEERGQKVKDTSKKCSISKELVYTSEMLYSPKKTSLKALSPYLLEPFKIQFKRYCCSAALKAKRL